MTLWRLLLLLSLFAASLPAPAAENGTASPGPPIPSGYGQETVDVDGVPLQVFTYRPAGCPISGLLLVFHGLDRNAADYRGDAVGLGRSLCRLVAAPLFDEARFPTWRYQQGGIVHGGAVQPEADWTVNLVPRLASRIRLQENRPDLPYALIGHSAGGQFLSRVAAFGQARATEIVIANPSTWVRPSLDVAAPFGFGGVYPSGQGEAALRRYLSAPVTVLLGLDDVGSRNLSVTEAAEAQGSTRLERGQTVFREAEQTARQHGWAFNWRLAIVPGVGHSAARMFNSEQALAALRP
jgi:pimeloyl-ACP methyl ester carboxylesterase